MDRSLELIIQPQPSETTCGPSCLHALYSYYGDTISLDDVIREVRYLEEGGTLAVFLACHALKRGYSARMYTYNLRVFDPTWFVPERVDLRMKLRAQSEAKNIPKIRTATEGYLEFLDLGGEILFEDLTTSLIRRHLKRGRPILTGLSSTYLYRSPREYGPKVEDDDIRGVPAGHFVVLCGYHKEERTVLVADPYVPNPYSDHNRYIVGIDRVLCSILLGVLTYDANLLVIKPKNEKARK